MQRLDVQQAGKFSDHNCIVWRLAWNVTGTMLATTGDDGYVRMWKSMNLVFSSNFFTYNKFLFQIVNYQRNWKSAAVLKPEGSAAGHLGNNGSGSGNIATAIVPATTNAPTKYYKRSTMSHSNQVPPY